MSIQSLDANILLPAVDVGAKDHPAAKAYLDSLRYNEDVVLSELILLELYNLIRNVKVAVKPLSPDEAVSVCQRLRGHPYWQIRGLPEDCEEFHDQLWELLRVPNTARRRAYDLRAGLALRHFGVTDFATANIKDFQGLGFARVWNPLAADAPSVPQDPL